MSNANNTYKIIKIVLKSVELNILKLAFQASVQEVNGIVNFFF